MSQPSRARRIASSLVAIAVVLGVVYGAAALLSPIPLLTVVAADALTADAFASGAPISDELVMPEQGSTAVDLGLGEPVTAGSLELRPIAGAAKVVLVNVVLAVEPLEVGRPGPAITIDQQAVDRYRELEGAGARTVLTRFGETWTLRDLIAATLLGSGNNTAELLVDEVFGGVEGYLGAAETWLAEQGLEQTRVVDGTGLDSGSRSTAAELARIGRLTIEHPVLADLLQQRPRETTGGARVPDEAAFISDVGTIGIVRSYTDAAGVCVLMIVPADDGSGADSAGADGAGGALVSVAMLGQPGYPQAEREARALVESIAQAVRPVEVISTGQVVGTLESAWGQSTELVATGSTTISSIALGSAEVRIDAAARSTIVRGTDAGTLVVTVGDVEQVVRLESAGAITAPGVAWRFTDPLTVIQRWTG